MKIKPKFKIFIIFTLCASILFSYSAVGADIENKSDAKKDYIKWMTFDVPDKAMLKAMNIDIKYHGTDKEVDWIEVLSILAANYYGRWERYKPKDMDAVVEKLQRGESAEEITHNNKYYNFYHEAYSAVLSGFLGEYKTVSPVGSDNLVEKYGMLVFSPIAKGYYYSHYDDFGNSRTYGYKRKHMGNDLLGSVGTPIIAVESGYVECMGWDSFGGWRIGIRSFDRKRYYYYAHLRKDKPYVQNLKQGMLVKAGEVIGYLGATGYSNKENVNNMSRPHLHFGMQIIFDESQKEGVNQIWIDVYDIVNVLAKNKASVRKDPQTGDYYSTSLYY
ncbi:MAG: M23 family metallopeptidase [[Clostridium] cellulosi]|nr:MAG: M23 family peptidase [[Clostridium] cellulosi]